MSIQKYKYPKTKHCPWSPGTQSDDRILESMNHFHGKEVVVTEKLDGENTSIYKGFFHARSLDSPMHPSRSWVAQMIGERLYDLPEHLRICGENCYALHSIHYKSLEDYFFVFSIWDNEKNVCLSWDETLEWCALLNLKTVPVLYRGTYDEELIKNTLFTKVKDNGDEMEGYVIRMTNEFAYDDFAMNMAKYVRAKHVQPDAGHWLSKPVTPNELAATIKE